MTESGDGSDLNVVSERDSVSTNSPRRHLAWKFGDVFKKREDFLNVDKIEYSPQKRRKLSTSLLSNVFNYDLGMMKDKSMLKAVRSENNSSTEKENLIPPVMKISGLHSLSSGNGNESMRHCPPLPLDSIWSQRTKHTATSGQDNQSSRTPFNDVSNMTPVTRVNSSSSQKENLLPPFMRMSRMQCASSGNALNSSNCATRHCPPLASSCSQRTKNTTSTGQHNQSSRTPFKDVSNTTRNTCVSSATKSAAHRKKKTPKSVFSNVFATPTPSPPSSRAKAVGSTAKNLYSEINAEGTGTDYPDSTHCDFDDIEYATIRDNEVPDYECYSDDENEDNVNWASDENYKAVRKVPYEYASLGAPSVRCSKCDAWMWKEERVNKNCTKGTPEFSICCQKGEVQLPKEKPTPEFLMRLYTDKEKGNRFKNSVRLYNSMFAFTSTGGRVDHSINCGGAPYVYRLNGQNHHLFGSLIPDEGQPPKFCQLYIYDTANETNNRLRWINVQDGKEVDAAIVDGLSKMLDETNELVHEFRTQRDRFEQEHVTELEITLKISRADSGRENHVVPSDDLAGIMVGDLDENCGTRDIVIHSHEDGLQRISDIHPKLMALQYPLLFPHGDDGFHINLQYGCPGKKKRRKRELISMKEYYSYKFQVRMNEGMTPRLGGRLFQQYVVDAFSTIEQARLWWFRRHQTTLRNELYSQICDSLRRGEVDSANVGKSIILPSGFVGSRRYMQQNFQDALAVCRYVGHPDVFLTMTTNPLWDEILKMMNLTHGCLPQNSPDIIARVFKLKLDQLLQDVRKNSVFGKCIGVMYVVEFQKRGLPHVHMLIWLDAASKKELKQNPDKFVSAEIPDPDKDKAGYEAVKAFMIHGPCGREFPKSPCMKDYKCIRHFPKKYSPSTTFDESGFPIYKRRNTGITVNVRKADLDNKWVVPYNRDLLVKYQCHINVEICCHARSIKYLFKYCLKGHDRATVEIKGKRRSQENSAENVVVDEINEYFDGRYICAAEAAYRIFGYNIHYRSISVQRLSFHLPGDKSCTFKSDEPLAKVVKREKIRHSQLEAFFHLNRTDQTANKYTYDEIPQYYVWNEGDCMWNPRKRGQMIGRMFYTHHSTGELWYLRLLLTKVRGPTSFKSLRTVNDKVCSTYQEACKEMGLLDDDNEWDQVLQQCGQSGFPPQLRQLFVHLMVNCRVTDLGKLWKDHCKNMTDDILIMQRKLTNNPNLLLNDKQLEYYALAEIHKLLKSIGKSLKDFGDMPQPPRTYLDTTSNSLISEETSYDTIKMAEEHEFLRSKCNAEQLEAYNSIMEAVDKNQGGLFFVYGSGGCGKTFLWKTLITKLRSESKIVLPVASSGIAATLMPGGRTAHSRFRIPIILDEHSVCAISQNSDIAQLIQNTSLIIWDEAPMQHRYAFECLDRSLRDIMKTVDPSRLHMPFGGITVVLGGDFRQILPVIPFASRSEIVAACITRSKLWDIVQLKKLEHNMRLNKGNNADEVERMTDFANWVLDVGDGNIDRAASGFSEEEICIPEEFCGTSDGSSIEEIFETTFPDFTDNYQKPQYLSDRAILTPTNNTVSHLNSLIVDKIPGQSFSYFSTDKAEDFPGTETQMNNSFPPEYLNSMNPPGLPHHELKLKVGTVVMLMRNLNQTLGLCNGTRMMVTKCLPQCVECEVICGSFMGSRHFIPRMDLCPSDSKLPFKLLRKQMPLQICYCMTINKAQGQSLQNVGLFLPKPVFTHGQLYVAVSRVTSPEGLKIFIQSETGQSTNITHNVVYKEVFYNL